MARPVRIEVAGAWYHVTARGNERKAVFRDERDRVHFLELVGQLPERFGLGVHAYVLMDNHYHLLVQNGGANLSQAMQWLQVSYTVWFNRRHQRVGHLFGGRYQAIVLEDGAAAEVSRYVHLNPVRVQKRQGVKSIYYSIQESRRERSALKWIRNRPDPSIVLIPPEKLKPNTPATAASNATGD